MKKDQNAVTLNDMTPAEDLLMALKDEADSENEVLRYLLGDYEGDARKEKMLFF